jgi:hypothetical protein
LVGEEGSGVCSPTLLFAFARGFGEFRFDTPFCTKSGIAGSFLNQRFERIIGDSGCRGLFLKGRNIYRIISLDGNCRLNFSEWLPAIGFASGECRAGKPQEIPFPK